MFSDQFFKSQGFWINKIASKIGATPYKVDIKKKRLYTSKRTRCLSGRVLMFLIGQNIFLLVGMAIRFKNGDTNEFNQVYLGWVLSTLWTMSLGLGVLKTEQGILASNCFFIFLERFDSLYMPHYNPNSCKINKLIDLVCFWVRRSCTALAVLQMAFGFLYCRKSPYYIDYYIPDEFYTTWVWLSCMKLHIIISIVTSLILGIAFTFIFALLTHLNFIIAQDILCCRRNSYRTLNSLRTGQHMRITYRSLEILVQMLLDVCGIVLYPMNWFMLKMVVVCGASLIKYHSQMSPLVRNLMAGWTLTGIVFWGVTLEVCGYMALYSQRALNSWKYHDWGAEGKVMSKFKKSCKPMKVAYHKMFSIKRLSVLKFLKSVAKSLFKAIVSF